MFGEKVMKWDTDVPGLSNDFCHEGYRVPGPGGVLVQYFLFLDNSQLI